MGLSIPCVDMPKENIVMPINFFVAPIEHDFIRVIPYR